MKNIALTLDNPVVLEQQLEALEHHKKVLERKAQLQHKLGIKDVDSSETTSPVQYYHNKSTSNSSNESSATISPTRLNHNTVLRNSEQDIYANQRVLKNMDVKYATSQSPIVYTNLSNENSKTGDDTIDQELYQSYLNQYPAYNVSKSTYLLNVLRILFY